VKNKLDAHIGAYQGENIYDFDNEILLNWYPKRIVAQSRGARSVLELGLGHGFSTKAFSETFRRHVVLEGSPAVIDNFKINNPGSPSVIVETYFENFHTTEKFDVIVMGFVLEHVDDPILILRRFADYLTPAGKVFVAVPNAEVLNRRFGKAAGLLVDVKELSEHDQLLGHKRYYTVDTLRKDLSIAGYEVEKLEGIYLKPFTTKQIRQLKLDPMILRAMCEVGIEYPELSCGILAQVAKVST